jgi:hypothetical protein
MEERRGRPKEIIHEPAPRKFIRVYEDELTTETWKFDLNKFANGPIEVDIKYKAGAEKLLKQMAKEAKQEKKIAKQMKKINEKQNGKKN